MTDDWKLRILRGMQAVPEDELADIQARQARLLQNAYAPPDYAMVRNVPVFGDVPVLKPQVLHWKWWQFWRHRTAPP